MVKRLPAMWKTRVHFLGQEDPLEKEMAIHSSTLAWKIPWTEELDRLQSMGSQRVGHYWATSLSLIAKSVKNLPAMQDTQVRSLCQKDPLENEMATHCSILAWKIPWTEEPGGPQSLGSQELDMTKRLNLHHQQYLLLNNDSYYLLSIFYVLVMTLSPLYEQVI